MEPAHPTDVGAVLLAVAALVLAAKLAGLAVERIGLPAVLGELLAGIGLANFVPFASGGVEFVRAQPTLSVLAELGVLVLLFDVGLEADVRALVRVGGTALLVALTGVVVPASLGWLVGAWLMPHASTMTHVFLGATLAATSVGITARVLKDLRASHTREAQIILGAAVLDDVLGLVVLAVLSGAARTGGDVSPLAAVGILARAAALLAAACMIGVLCAERIARVAYRLGHGMIVVVGLALCFAVAFAAERLGLAAVIGAFAAGLMLDPYGSGVRTAAEQATLRELVEPLGNFFVPLFFVLIGLEVNLRSVAAPATFALASVLTVVAVAGKLACGLVTRGSIRSRLAVGFGMTARGEVGLIFAGIGATLVVDGRPLLSQGVLSAVVLTVVVTTILAPIGLRAALRAPAIRRE